jgi:drug/metabolite transporter (DMT)-like permease
MNTRSLSVTATPSALPAFSPTVISPVPTHPSRTALLFGFAAIYVIWGSTYLGIRVAVETMPPFLMAGARFLVAGSLLFGVLLLRGASWPTAAQWRDQAIVGTCLLLGGNALVAWAEQTVPSGLTTLILGASPFIMVIMDWARPGGSGPATATWLGLATGFAGLYVLLGPGALPASARPAPLALVALFSASFAWWGGSLYGKHAKSGAAPLMAAALQMLCGSFAMLAAGLLLGESTRVHLAAISAHSWLAWGYLVVAGSLVAYPVYVWLLRHSTPARVSTYAYVNPIVAVILGWAVLGEPLTPRIAVAAVIIIGAVAIITITKSRVPPPKPASA